MIDYGRIGKWDYGLLRAKDEFHVLENTEKFAEMFTLSSKT